MIVDKKGRMFEDRRKVNKKVKVERRVNDQPTKNNKKNK